MKKIWTLLLCPFLAWQAHAQFPAVLESRLQDTLEDMRAKYDFKGLSAAVSFKGMGTWKSAVGASAGTSPLKPEMLIGIGSNTKTFVSALMIRLSENGQVKLSDTIGTWLPGYAHINGSITIRQVLNHTSGLNNYTNNAATWDTVNRDLSRMWTKDEILRKFVQAPSFAPGTSWQYSNTNYIIAGIIEEQITGRSIQDLLRDSIMVTAGLKHTFFPPYEIATDPYANLWSDFDGDGTLDDVGEYATSTILPKEINSLADAAGGLVSTAEDNVHFWEALMQGRIISKASVRNELLKWTGFGTASSDYGLGVFKGRYLGNTIFSHGGTWIGQTNENLSDTTRNIFITVLSNQDALQNDYVALVVQALYKVALDYQKLDVDEFSTTTLSRSVYPNPAGTTLHIDAPLKGNEQLSIYDFSGRLLQRIATTGTQQRIDVSGLANGMYLLQLAGTSGTQTIKFMVQH